MVLKFGTALVGGGPDFSGIVTVKEVGEYRHRILSGGQSSHTTFYPSMDYDSETEELRQKWIPLRRDTKKGSPFLDSLAKAFDNSIKRSTVPGQNVRTLFTPNKRFAYLIFDRDNGEDVVKVAQYPYQVASKLQELQKKRDIKDKNNLRYGPNWSWDAIITHAFDKHKKGPDWTKHSYDVEVYEPDFKGVFPFDILDPKKYPNPIEALDSDWKEKLFTEAEWKAIDDFELDLDEFTKPHTEDEIKESICVTNKIYLSATDANTGNPIFSDPEDFLNELKDMGLEDAILEEGHVPEQISSGDDSKKEIKLSEPESNASDEGKKEDDNINKIKASLRKKKLTLTKK